MRIFMTMSFAVTIAACQQPAPEQPVSKLPRIACAHAGQPLRTDCTVETQGAIMVVRHPDGAFRRFALTDRGVDAADGAARASRARNGTLIVAGDRYVLAKGAQ